MSIYLYGVISAAHARKGCGRLGAGVGEVTAPVRSFGYRDLAAVVSRLASDAAIGESGGARALRRDMQRHTEILNKLADSTTVLPARFGVAFPDEQMLLESLLEPEYEQLVADLERLEDQIELGLTAQYPEEKLLAQIAAQQPQLFARPSHSYHEKIELGRKIAAAIAVQREMDEAWLLDRLRPLLTDVSLNRRPSDLTVLRAGLLLPRSHLKKFDQELSHLQKEAGSRMKLACVGPLPPYSFVHVRVHAGELAHH